MSPIVILFVFNLFLEFDVYLELPKVEGTRQALAQPGFSLQTRVLRSFSGEVCLSIPHIVPKQFTFQRLYDK